VKPGAEPHFRNTGYGLRFGRRRGRTGLRIRSRGGWRRDCGRDPEWILGNVDWRDQRVQPSLVFRRHAVAAIDYQNVERDLGRLQPESQLFLNRRKERRD